MIYEGKAITVKALESGIVELKFDLKGESVNKFNRLTLNELRQAVDAIKADASIKGVIVSSGKDVFIVGADITEFVPLFQRSEQEIAGFLRNGLFKRLHIHTVPTLHFLFDRTTERAADMNALIAQAVASRSKNED